MALAGEFGERVRVDQEEYGRLAAGPPILLRVVSDFYSVTGGAIEEIRNIRFLTFQIFIVTYREAKRRSPTVAATLVNSFIEDYPGAPESSLTTKWTSLARAGVAFRAVAGGSNSNLIWQQSVKLFQAYNEFLNGLFGYLIALWRAQQGRRVNPRVHACVYGDKVNQLSELTGGDDGLFYLLLRLARPKIRNAIAHESIWLDSDQALVHYVDVTTASEDTLPLTDFMALAMTGSHLAQPYLAALAAIALLEDSPESVANLPEHLVRLFQHGRGNGN